jgi:hypothetical protein
VTVNRLAQLLVVDREWVERRLKEYGFSGEVRCQPGYGKPAVHYSPEVLETLKPLAKEHPQANGWLTANALEELTATSANWVRLRLREMMPEGELRKDGQGVPRLHFPPEVGEEMLRRKAVLEKLRGRQTTGLQFRIAILRVLSDTAELMTVTAVNSQLEGDYIDKQVYDGLRWLAQRGLASKVGVPGKPKTRWFITNDGRMAITDSNPAVVSA